MTASTDYDYSYFDSLIIQDRSFSVYHIPGNKTITFAIQQEGTPEYLENLSELNGKDGFLIAPFEVTTRTPIVLLHPDVVLEGENHILTFLNNVFEKTPPSDMPPILPEDKQTTGKSDSFSTYKKAFELFQSALRSNTCEKIVLSRTLNLPKPLGFSAGKTFKEACEAYPEAFIYLCHTPKTGTWLGSSPELILSGEKKSWHTVALAGTMKVSTENETIIWDEKNIREQHIVADYLENKLNSHHLICTKNGPYASKAGRMMHLKTEFNFQMNHHDQIGNLLESLHPTPAVCGYPKEKAYRLIIDKEGYDRTYYSGLIGELSNKSKTNLYVNLRCMQIRSDILTFFAGGGLLSSSELESEWEETEEKLQTMLSLIDCIK